MSEAEEEIKTFEFDEDFQTKIAAFVVRDTVFNQMAEGLIKPEYFTNVAQASLVKITLGYYAKYKQVPDLITMKALLKSAFANKTIREDMRTDVVSSLLDLQKADISDRDFVVEQVAEFVQHQAIEAAILKSVQLLDKRRFDEIKKAVTEACDIGSSVATGEYDYFKEIESRTERRKELASGAMKPRGITTGMAKFDELLYHKGWGRRELTVLMGGAKSGKTTALIEFARGAAFAGYNVLYVTLEVSKEIIADRMDANIAEVYMSKLEEHIIDVDSRIKAAMAKAGKLKFEEFPTGTMKPSDLRRLLSKYRGKGIVFDLVVVDYADIMAPEYRTDSAIENSKSVYVELRALAQEEGCGVLTATQTNREGFKSVVAKAEHVSEDFNKIRIADLIISINATEDERKDGEARLYFAASRNQKGNYTVRISQDLERMKFIRSIIGVE